MTHLWLKSDIHVHNCIHVFIDIKRIYNRINTWMVTRVDYVYVYKESIINGG